MKNSLKSIGNGYHIVKATITCAQVFSVDTVDPCPDISRLRIVISEEDFDNIISQHSFQFGLLLKHHASTCTHFSFPANTDSYLVVFNPLGSIEFNITPVITMIEKNDICSPQLNMVEIIYVRENSASKSNKYLLDALKYKYNLYGNVNAMFGNISGKMDYLLLLVKRNKLGIPCSVNVHVTFFNYSMPNNLPFLDGIQYGVHSNITYTEDSSWNKALEHCNKQHESQLLAFSDIQVLYNVMHDIISQSHIDKHVPVFIGAKRQDVVSLTNISV